MPRSGPGPLTGVLSIRTSPEVGGMKPAMIKSNVLFPQPLGPTMLRNSFSPTSKLRPFIASTAPPLMAWNALVRPRTAILAMSSRQVRVVDIPGHLNIPFQKPQLVEPRNRVLQVLRRRASVQGPVDVLLGEVVLLQHGLGQLELRSHRVDDRIPVLRSVDVPQQADVIFEERPHRIRRFLQEIRSRRGEGEEVRFSPRLIRVEDLLEPPRGHRPVVEDRWKDPRVNLLALHRFLHRRSWDLHDVYIPDRIQSILLKHEPRRGINSRPDGKDADLLSPQVLDTIDRCIRGSQPSEIKIVRV